ncbi:hypothetical protein A0256_06940 [Mucilaginibacter sp. PAMC 26640]|nr:hypothetical protein A0256_06940 [Mucilaginibacter sp. PAMC 26640]
MAIRVTCALIINNEGKVLVAQRSTQMSLPLKWEFPGGKIEPNESPNDCLVREIKEELDIDIRIVKQLPSNNHSYPHISIELIPFLCIYLTGEISLREHANFRWLPKDDLLALDWADADVPILYNYLNLSNVGN